MVVESSILRSKEADRFVAVVRALQRRKEKEGYRSGIAWGLATAFPLSESGSFTGLLQAIDAAEEQQHS